MMNQRIKELWYQAVQPHTGDSWSEQSAFMEKFAELIIRDVVDTVIRIQPTTPDFKWSILNNYELELNDE